MIERTIKINERIDAIREKAQRQPTPRNVGRWVLSEQVGVLAAKTLFGCAAPSELEEAMALFEAVLNTLETDALSVFNEGLS